MSAVETITKIVMCRNILDALKPLYFQLKIAGFLTFKVNNDTGCFKDNSKYLIVVCVLNSTLSIVSLIYYMPMIDIYFLANSLSVYLLQTLAIVFAMKIVVTDIFKYINRHKVLHLWKDIYLIDNVFLIGGVRSNYKIIKYGGSAIIWGQILLKIIVGRFFPDKSENFVVKNFILLSLIISNIRSAFISNEFVTLRIVVTYYFNKYFILLQKINTSATQLNQSKLLVSLYFHLCKLSRDVDRITSPQILMNLIESFLSLNFILFRVVALVIYVPENEVSLRDIFRLYLIIHYGITLAYIILPGYVCINMVSTLYFNLGNYYLTKFLFQFT